MNPAAVAAGELLSRSSGDRTNRSTSNRAAAASSSRGNATSSGGTYTEYVHRELFHVRKFDLVLHHADGVTEYDGSGCFSCFPPLGCSKPAYPPGQHITGYLLIRPMRRLIITGVAVTFSGQFVTSWHEDCLHWGSQQVFYRHKATVIENRRIDLDCKWYRFDFEYVLPHGLPSSFKEPEAKLIYFATGSVTQPEGAEIETYDTHFHINGAVDIDVFPSLWHESTERRLARTFPGTAADIVNAAPPLPPRGTVDSASCRILTNHSAVLAAAENGGVGVTRDCGVLCSPDDDPQLLAVLWINSQAYVIGGGGGSEVTADVKVDNHTHHHVEAALTLQQVLHIQASIAKENKGRREPPVYHFRKHRKTVEKEIATIWSTRVNPHCSETVSRIFPLPAALVPTMPQDLRHLPYPGGERLRELAGQRDPAVFIQYFVKLTLTPQWDGAEELQLPIEIKLGTKDSGTRFARSRDDDADAQTDTTENMERWDVPPSSEDAPPSYDEYFSGKPSASHIIAPNHDDGETISMNYEVDTEEDASRNPADLTPTSPGMVIVSTTTTTAPYASQETSPDDNDDDEDDDDDEATPFHLDAANSNHLFTALQPVEILPDMDTDPLMPEEEDEEEEATADDPLLSPADTMTSSTTTQHHQRLLLLCNGLISASPSLPQHGSDVDNLSGHFTDVSLSSPQDSLAGGGASSEALCGGAEDRLEIVSHITTA